MGTVFYNPKYVSSILDLYNPLKININRGIIKSHQKYDIP